jgi:hypothetical protein
VAVLVAFSVAPAIAQRDLTGMWRPLARNEDGSGLDGDYAGLPLSAEGRRRAQSWAPENFDVPEWVCRPHAFDFSVEAGAATMRLSNVIDDPTQKLIAIHGRLSMREQETDIYMDGRPRPPDYVLHTWSGFTTGEWEGTQLVTTITHLKERLHPPLGPDAERRCDGADPIQAASVPEYLRATVIIYDPGLSAEPYIRTNLIWVLDP